MNPVIVADIGGTNARFALVTRFDKDFSVVRIEEKQRYRCADFENFDSVFRCYLDSLEEIEPTRACIAVAGPVKDGQIRMTNLNWSISSELVLESFGLEQFELINDFTAMAHSTLFLGEESLVTICRGKPNLNASRCIIGPGTGLGVAALAPCKGRWATLSGEGGHITLASTGPYENRVIQQIAPDSGKISAETVLSGAGIVRLYKAICAIEEYPVLATTPREITDAALSDSEPAASAAVSLFCRLLGGLVGDMILTFGAEGGAYLAGGILPKIEPLLKKSDFELCVRNKGVMNHYLEDINVSLIRSDDAALVGAAAWLFSELETQA